MRTLLGAKNKAVEYPRFSSSSAMEKQQQKIKI
jgi:hypothetical protein